MADAHIQKVIDLGGDRLQVIGTVDGVTDDAGEPTVIVAGGWVSAMTNHYDEAAHYTAKDVAAMGRGQVEEAGGDPDELVGQRKPDAEPREMTDDEKLAYWSQLLVDAAGPTEAPETVLYSTEKD